MKLVFQLGPMQLKPGSQYDTRASVALRCVPFRSVPFLRRIVNVLCCVVCGDASKTQCYARIDSSSNLASLALRSVTSDLSGRANTRGQYPVNCVVYGRRGACGGCSRLSFPVAAQQQVLQGCNIEGECLEASKPRRYIHLALLLLHTQHRLYIIRGNGQ